MNDFFVVIICIVVILLAERFLYWCCKSFGNINSEEENSKFEWGEFVAFMLFSGFIVAPSYFIFACIVKIFEVIY